MCDDPLKTFLVLADIVVFVIWIILCIREKPLE